MPKKTITELKDEINRRDTTSEINKSSQTIREWALKTFANKSVEKILIWIGTIIGGAILVAIMQVILR